MIPHWLQAVVLVVGTYRLTRLAGWDDWPPIYKLRAWAIGEYWVPVDPPLAAMSFQPETELNLPGKQPSSEVSEVRPAYTRPLLAHLVHCPFCIGWWISLAVYIAWLIEPHWTLYALAPFALSGAVGVIAKNLDA